MLPIVQIVVLTFALSGEPVMVKTNSEEGETIFQFLPVAGIEESVLESGFGIAQIVVSGSPRTSIVAEFSSINRQQSISVADVFRRLTAEWREQARFDSSITDAVNRPAYQAIIKLNWEVVPLLLQDVKNGNGFWFPALAAITGIRPFDRKDAGDVPRMKQAWVSWGQKKGLV